MAHVCAVGVAPGVVRIPTVGAANTNSFALVDDDGSVTLVDCGLKRAPRRDDRRRSSSRCSWAG